MDDIIAGGKTPLIVDTTDEDSVRTFYSYKASVLDLQELFRGPVLGGLPAKDAMEQARVALVTAIKEGNTLVLYLGNLVPKLLQPKKFHAPNKFPECVFKAGAFDAPKERKKIFRCVAVWLGAPCAVLLVPGTRRQPQGVHRRQVCGQGRWPMPQEGRVPHCGCHSAKP